MKVKELIEKLSKLDPERDIWVGYDYPYDVQEPDFREYTKDDMSEYFYRGKDKEDRIKIGDYMHFAE